MVGRTVRFGMMGLLAIAAIGPLEAQENDFEWSGRMSDGQTLEVRGISGDVRAVLSSSSTAEVVAVKYGRDRDFDEVEIVLDETRNGIVICAIYGERRRNSCDSDDWDDGPNHKKSIDVSVDFEVRVPAGVEFRGRTVSGDVEAEGLRGDVDGATVSGDVTISTTGVARANTVSGTIDVEMASLDWDRLHFNTVSGDIILRVPRGLEAEIEFASLSGDFRSDFEVEVYRARDKFIGSELEGVIGNGGRELSFKTVSGDVRLRSTTGGTR